MSPKAHYGLGEASLAEAVGARGLKKHSFRASYARA